MNDRIHTRSMKLKKNDAYEPPNSVETEQDLIGAILKDQDSLFTILDYFTDPNVFYVPRHRKIFRSIVSLYDKGEPYDVTTVADELEKKEQLDKIGGRSYLVDLVRGLASTAHIESYAKIVQEKFLLRRLIEVSNSIITDTYDHSGDIDELLDFAEKNIFQITDSRMREEFTSIGSLIPGTFDQIENFQKTQGGLAGISSGFKQIDAKTGGFHGGDFIVVAGRPSMGKTAFALNIAEHISIENNVPIGIFSIEMSKEQLALRLLCGRARLSQHSLRTGRLKDSEWQKLTIAADPLGKAPIYVDDSGFLSSLEMRAKTRRLFSQHNVGVIVVDYIQMMTGSRGAENRQQEMAMISRAFKGLAKELNIPVIAISQLSRAVEQRGGDKRPQLSDLRESGAIEQDADLVMFVYRPEFYLSHLDDDDPKKLEAQGKAEIIIAKQRNGPTGKVDLTFHKDYIRFEEPDFIHQRPMPADTESPF